MHSIYSGKTLPCLYPVLSQHLFIKRKNTFQLVSWKFCICLLHLTKPWRSRGKVQCCVWEIGHMVFAYVSRRLLLDLCPAAGVKNKIGKVALTCVMFPRPADLPVAWACTKEASQAWRMQRGYCISWSPWKGLATSSEIPVGKVSELSWPWLSSPIAQHLRDARIGDTSGEVKNLRHEEEISQEQIKLGGGWLPSPICFDLYLGSMHV